MERRKRSANQEPVIVLDEEERMEPIHKLLKLDDRDKFKTIQSEMKTKGLVLSQTWSDLYSLMSKYQAELITREDQLIDIESQIDAQRKSAKDNELERMKLQIEAKDREIKLKSKLLAETQNELGRVKSVLRSKDELIRRLQCQVKVDGDSVMTGDSPAALSEQVSMKTTITTLTISSPAGIDTSSLLTDQKHSEHVQTNFSRSGSDDSGTGAEKTDAKYQVSSSNDEETDSFLVLESDVATINIPGQESGVLEEVQPGTSVTDDAGQTGASPDELQASNAYQPVSIPIVIKNWTDAQPKVTVEGCLDERLRRQLRRRSQEPSVPEVTDDKQKLYSTIEVQGYKVRVCSFCGKHFRDSSNFSKHVRIHTGEKPYACEYCHKRFSDATNCQRHKVLCFLKRSTVKVVTMDQDGKIVETDYVKRAPDGGQTSLG